MGNERAHAEQSTEAARAARSAKRRHDQAGPQRRDPVQRLVPLNDASAIGQVGQIDRVGHTGLAGMLGALFNLDALGAPASGLTAAAAPDQETAGQARPGQPARTGPRAPAVTSAKAAAVQRREVIREEANHSQDKDEKQTGAENAAVAESATPTPDTARASDGAPDAPPSGDPSSDGSGGPPTAGPPAGQAAGGSSPEGPPTSPPGDDPVSVHRQPQSQPGGDGAPAGEEITPEEAERQLKEAKEKGAASAASKPAKEKGEKGADAPSEGETEGALKEKADKADAKGGGAQGAAGKGSGEGSGDKLAGMAAAPPTDDSTLPGFADEVNGGRLAQYATERAWHDQWTQSAEASNMTTEDRAELVGEALLTGGVNGLTNAAAAIVIDQVINRATKSIPYASGFIALGQLAYDPKAWVDGSFVQPGKNIAEGGSKVWAAITGKGDVIDGLEGVVDVLDGINSLIATISTICMIVAAVLGLSGIVLAIFGVGAALLSAAAICMKAGVFLGKISTIAGIIISALRVILIAARAIQIMVSDADPETQAQRAASLQQQTQKLTSETAQRYANKHLNKKAEKAAKDREGSAETGPKPKGDAKTPDTGAADTVAQTEGKRGKVTKALDLLSAGGFSGNTKEAKETWNKDSKEFAPKSHQAAIDKRRQEQAAPGRRQAAQSNLARADQGVATDKRRQEQAAQERANDAQSKLTKAEQDLAEARAKNMEAWHVEDRARTESRSARAAYEAAKRDPNTPTEDLQRLKETSETASKALGKVMNERTVGPFRDHMLKDKAKQQAAENAQRAQEELSGPVTPSPAAALARNRAAEQARSADEALLRAPGETREATREAALPGAFTGGLKETGSSLKDTFGSRQGFWAGGVAPTNEGYGHQNTAGTTGVGTGIAMEALGPKLELDGVKGRTDKENANWAQEMRQNVEEAKFGQALPPPPPRTLEGELDAAGERYAELDLEERRIKFQRKEVAALQASATEEMTALQAVQALAAANQQAIDGEQQELDKKTAVQQKLKDKATSMGQDADQADQKHQSQAPALSDFTGKFVSLMGMVPSKLVGNSGEGSGSAQQLGDGFGQGGDGAKDGKSMSTGALQHADKLGTKTGEARSSFGQSASDLQALKSLTTQCTEDTVSGQQLLAQSAASSQQKLQEIAQKKQAERQKQETAVATMTGWAQTHYDARTGGKEELESQLSEAEAGIEERTAETDGGTGTDGDGGTGEGDEGTGGGVGTDGGTGTGVDGGSTGDGGTGGGAPEPLPAGVP